MHVQQGTYTVMALATCVYLWTQKSSLSKFGTLAVFSCNIYVSHIRQMMYVYLTNKTRMKNFEKESFYCSVPYICPPSRISLPPPLPSCIGPPTMAILPKWSSSKLLHCQVQGPHGNARTKPASIEQIRNLPSIANVFASGVNQQQHIERTNQRNAWKTPLSMLWPTSVCWSWPSSFWGLGDDRISSEGRSAASTVNIYLGVAPEEGAYSRDKMSDRAYKLPLRFWLGLRLQNGGRICETLRYLSAETIQHKYISISILPQ